MQLLRPLLLRRLRAALQLIIPVAVAADTARSVVVTYQLAQQRLKVSWAAIVAAPTSPACRRPPPPWLLLPRHCLSPATPLPIRLTQEWEEEYNEETQAEIRSLLRAVAHRCAAKDGDFWPPGLSLGDARSHGGPHGSLASGAAATAEGDEAAEQAADIWQLLGLTACGGSGGGGTNESASAELVPPSAAAAEAAAAEEARVQARWAAAEAEGQLVSYEQQQQQQQQGACDAAAASRPARQGATLVVVSLREALGQVAGNVAALQLPWSTLMQTPQPPPGVVRVTLGDVADILGSTCPARAAADGGHALCRAVLAAADAAREEARRALPWPQLQISRVSALRWGQGGRDGEGEAGTVVGRYPTELHSCWLGGGHPAPCRPLPDFAPFHVAPAGARWTGTACTGPGRRRSRWSASWRAAELARPRCGPRKCP